MSEAWRQRRLHVENRLAELNAKYGAVQDTLLEPGPQSDPSWGPIGSLAGTRPQAPAQAEEWLVPDTTPDAPPAQNRVPEASGEPPGPKAATW